MASEFAPTKEELAEERRIAQNREIIIESLKTIKYQSSKHLCVNTGLSIDDVLHHVDLDEAINYKVIGDGVTVYFLKENDPNGQRLYMTGKQSFAVADNEKTEIVKQKKSRRVKPKVDLKLLEHCAAEGLTVKAAAVKLGIPASRLSTMIHNKTSLKDYREAWERGKGRQNAETTDLEIKTEVAEPRKKESILSLGKGVDMQAKIWQCLRNGMRTVQQIEKATNFDPQSIWNILNKNCTLGKVRKVSGVSCNEYELLSDGEMMKSEEIEAEKDLLQAASNILQSGKRFSELTKDLPLTSLSESSKVEIAGVPEIPFRKTSRYAEAASLIFGVEETEEDGSLQKICSNCDAVSEKPLNLYTAIGDFYCSEKCHREHLEKVTKEFPEEIVKYGKKLYDRQVEDSIGLNLQSEPRFADTLTHLVENGRSREGIERVEKVFIQENYDKAKERIKEQLSDFSVSLPPVPTHTKIVRFKNGKVLSIASDINFFDADERERQFMNELTDLIQKFEVA